MEKIHKILAIDDDELNLIYYDYSLKAPDVFLLKAKSGLESLEIVKKEKDLSLILLDVQMPVMDGYETLRRIRELENGRDVPVIYITANNKSEDNIERGYMLGASDYLIKPVSGKLLKNKVSVFLKVQFDKKSIEDKTAELMEQKDFITNIINTVPSYIFVLDKDLQLIFSNFKDKDFTTNYGSSFYNSFINKLRPYILNVINIQENIKTEIMIENNSAKSFFYFRADLSGFIGASGSPFALVSLSDITKRKIAELELKSINKYEQTVADISAYFVASDDFDNAINYSLNKLGYFTNADRAYLFQFDNISGTMSNTHEWCAAGVKPEMENLQNLKTDIFPYWMSKLKEGEIINITDVSQMHQEAKAEKEILEMQNIKSVLVLPVISTTTLYGFLGFDNTSSAGEWSLVEVNLLNMFSGIIASAIERKYANEELLTLNRSLHLLSECNLALLTADNEKELYFAFADILTMHGGYPFVWISKIKRNKKDEVVELIAMAESGKSKYTEKERNCEKLENKDCPIIIAAEGNSFVLDLKMETCGECCKDFEKIDLKAGFFVPIKSKDNHISIINIFTNDKKKFTDDERALLHDIASNLAYGLDSLYDKNKRVKYEEQLASEKEELTTTLRSIADGVITTKSNGEIALCNRAAGLILDLEPSELTDKVIYDIFKVLDKDNNIVLFNPIDLVQSNEGSENIDLQLTIASKNGENKVISLKISAIKDVNKYFKGVVIVFNDITQQLKAETQKSLSQKLESIGQLAAGIAHEINTPLQFVGDNAYFLNDGFTSLFELIDLTDNCLNDENTTDLFEIAKKYNDLKVDIDYDFLKEEIPKAIERSQNGIKRVSKIVQAMKSFAYHSGKKKSLSNINKGIEVTVAISRNEWKYVADLIMLLDDNIPLVVCSLDEINQVILNMIVNAAHAIEERYGKETSNKGEIKIVTSVENEFVIIEISDTGIGIDQEKINRIFDPFYTTKEVGKGTGQGLAISHDIIVNKHNGKILVESERSKGTIFKIHLPVKGNLNG